MSIIMPCDLRQLTIILLLGTLIITLVERLKTVTRADLISDLTNTRGTTLRNTINWSNVKLITDKNLIKDGMEYVYEDLLATLPEEADPSVEKVWFCEKVRKKKNRIRIIFLLKAFRKLTNFTATLWVNPKPEPIELRKAVYYKKFKIKSLDVFEKFLRFYT